MKKYPYKTLYIPFSLTIPYSPEIHRENTRQEKIMANITLSCVLTTRELRQFTESFDYITIKGGRIKISLAGYKEEEGSIRSSHMLVVITLNQFCNEDADYLQNRTNEYPSPREWTTPAGVTRVIS